VERIPPSRRTTRRSPQAQDARSFPDPRVVVERVCLVIAVTMTLVLLWASVTPAAGRIAPSETHHFAHFATFGVLAVAWSFAYPRAPWVLVMSLVVAFGFVQETIEIVGHGHAFEFLDAIVDAVGTAAGVAASRLLLALFARVC
jgi:hypothetical protein